MKSVSDKVSYMSTNAWGQMSSGHVQSFEVEAGDVGVTRGDYRGQGHSSYTFKASDVGRLVHSRWDDAGWACWEFGEG